jgi:hypothetical protein
MCSMTAVAGAAATRQAFWSHVVASHEAARAAGSDVPMTKPK